MDIQQIRNGDYPKLNCDKHQECNLEFINIDLNKGRAIVCPECSSENEINAKDLIPLSRLFKPQQDDMILKWPIFRSKDIVQTLQDNKNEDETQQMIKQIEVHFEQLTNDLVQLISQARKSIITHINQLKQRSEQVQNAIKKMVNIESLQNIFQSSQGDIQKLNDSLTSFIRNAIDSQKMKEEQILEDLKELKMQESLFTLQNMELKSKDLIETVSKIQYIDSQTQQKVQIIQDSQREIELDGLNGNNNQSEELLQKFELKKLNNCYKNNFSIIETDNKQFVIETPNNFYQWRFAYLDYPIQFSEKYEIEIKFLSKINNNEEIFIGLSRNDEYQYQWEDNLSFYTENINWGISQVEKGQHISKIKNDLDILCFQIYLQQKVLRCLGVVNGAEQVVSLEDEDRIQNNEKYYFYIGLYLPNSKIQINSFKKVSNFKN